MQKEDPFVIKPWMWIVTAMAALLLAFNFDPIGDALEKAFGQGADKWAINIALVVLIIFFFIKKK